MNDIVAALRALAESDRETGAPAEVEARVVRAFRRKQAWRKWKWAAAAAAAVAIATVVGVERIGVESLHAGRPAIVEGRPVMRGAAIPAAVTAERTITRPRAVQKRQPREIATEFFPLIEAAPPVGRGEIVRVTIPASVMRTVGLPVREERLSDRVQADVLVSEDGLATAIRFVKWQ